jgi:hypothetical protein
MHTRSIRCTVVALVVATAGLVPAVAAAAPATAPASPAGAPALDAAIVHGVPTVPLTIDGVPVPGERITDHDGRVLYTVLSPDPTSAHGRLDVYTTQAGFEKAVRAAGGPENAMAHPKEAAAKPVVHGPVPTPGTDGTIQRSGYTYLYSGDWYSYFGKELNSGWWYPDLTRVDMVCVIWCVSWNDEASSAWADNYGGMMLYEHIHAGGSRFFIPGGYAAPTLSYYGWDNRVSSFAAYA